MRRFLPNHVFPVSIMGILMLLVLVALVPMLIVEGGILTAWYYSRWAQQESATLDTAQEVAATFEAYVLDVHRQELAIGATLAGPHSYTTKEANAFLTAAGQGYPSIRCWSWTDTEGKIIASNQPTAIGWNCGKEEFFQTLRDGGSWVVSDHRIDPTDGLHVFFIATRINDEKGSMAGVVIATVEIANLAKRALDLFRPVGEAVALFDRQGTLVYNSRQQSQGFQDWRTRDPLLSDALQYGKTQVGILILENDDKGSEKCIAARVPVYKIGWVAGARVPMAQALASVYTGLWIAGGLTLLVAVGSCLLALTIAYILIHQLRQLQSHAQSIGQGDFSHSAEIAGVRELAQLATAFNQTGTAVRDAQEAMEAVNATLEQRVRQRTTELDATIQTLRNTDEELRAASLYARGLIEASLDPLVTISPEGKITDVNEATASAVGVPRDQLIGRDFADYFTEPDKARDGYQIVLSQGLVRDYALTIRHASGSMMDVLYNAVVYRNEAGEVEGVFAAARDVTERRRMEKELDKYRVHLEELVQQRTEQLEDANRQLKEEIAERKQAAKEIERVASFPTLNPNPLSEIDLEGRLHYLNPAAERLFPDLRGRGADHPWLVGWEPVARELRNGNKRTSTREVIVGDRCFQQTIHYVEQIQRIRIYGLDVTQRKQAEQAILEREEELSAIYENAPLVMLVVDQDRRVCKANRLAEHFACASTDELLALRGGEALRCVHSLDDPQGCGFGPSCQECMVRRTIAQTLETGQSQSQVEVGLTCTLQGESKNFTFLLSTARLNVRGQPQALVTIQDISDRKRAEEALQKAHDELETRVQERTAELNHAMEALEAERRRFIDVLDMLPAYVVLLTQDYYVPFANRYFRERFGESHGRRCFEYLFGRTEPCENCDTFTVFKTNAPHRWEWIGPDGHNYDISDFPFTDTDGSHLVLEMGIDITERKLAEAELAKHRLHLQELVQERTSQLETVNAQLEAEIVERIQIEESLQRSTEQLKRSNEELEQFAYVASHDLQEPLRVVNGYVQLIERKFQDHLDADAEQFIFYIVDGVERMRQLITDLLNYSRVGSRGKDFCPISVQAVLNRVSENLKKIIEESGAVIAYSSLPEVHADESQLIQLFQNLIVNGIKFHGKNPPRIEISASREGDKWVFAVRDNGIGIDPQYWDQIFVIFQRLHTRQKYPGTGIGLAICKRIIERHGGRIWLDSQPGQGTTFYFTLS